jgi:UV DNA damage endonuclease
MCFRNLYWLLMNRLGFAVKVLGDGGLPSHDTRRWQNRPHLSVSLERLAAILERLDAIDVRMYRMASALAPYATHPELPQFHHQVEECEEELARTGARARALDIRLSFHPGQYVVLNSERAGVREIAARELDTLSSLLDAMGCGPEAVVVLHVGGSAGGRDAALERFERGLELVGEAGRRRLVIENDDRSFGLGDVLELHRRTGLRVVWDAHHHACLNPDAIPEADALRAALATWPEGVVPKIHFSSPREPGSRAHADMIDAEAFRSFLRGPAAGLEFDTMLEAKAKDLALLALRDALSGDDRVDVDAVAHPPAGELRHALEH